MNEFDHFSKYRFTALFEHFKTVVNDLAVEDVNEKVAAEFNNLLNNFQIIYQDSERKSNKIRLLIAEKTNLENNLKTEAEKQNEAMMELRKQLSTLKTQIRIYNDEKFELVNKIEKLKTNTRALIDAKYNFVENADAEVQVEMGEISFFEHNLKDNKNPIPNNQTQKQSDADYKLALNLLKKKVHVLKTHIKFNQLKMKHLQEKLEIKTQNFNDCCSKVSNLEKQNLEFEEYWRRSKKSYEAEVKELSEKLENLHGIKHQMKNTIDVLVEENKTLLVKQSEKAEDINEKRLLLSSLIERLSSMNNLLKNVEKHLLKSNERIVKGESEIDRLRKTAKELKSEITKQKVVGELKAVALKEGMIESEKLEEKRLTELYKKQLSLRNETLENLKKKLFENNRSHNATKKDLAKKSNYCSSLLEEISCLKITIVNLSSKNRQLRLQLKDVENSNSKLKKEIELQKLDYNELIKERNKFQALYNKLLTIQSQHEFEISLLSKSQTTMRNSLKLKEQQLNSILSKRRQKWINNFRSDNCL